MQRSVTIVLTAVIAAAALAACSGGKQTSSSTTTTTTTQSSPAASPSTAASAAASAAPKMVAAGGASAAAGAKVFTTNCSSCHQANGKGQPGVFPPLAGNATVTGPADKVIAVVKNGLNGKISVNGTTYNGQMPAWKGTLSDSDIASVITYIRSSWGNKASAVAASQVSAAK
ncbi:MAG TPA: cytochrome c [Candidatus Baltobacteraceae bacterium]|nr:cytochrome c [Candidatus Baltobacteraceae bacterium]